MHAGLDTHPNPCLAVRLDTAHAAAKAACQRRGKLRQRLPVGTELAGLRALVGDAETVLLEELPGHRPDFRRRTLGHDPAAITAALQAVVADVAGVGQRLRTRNLVLTLFFVGGGDVQRNRQQRIERLAVHPFGQLHGRRFAGAEVVVTAVAEIALRPPQPAAAGSVADNQGEGGQSSQSLHCVELLDQANTPVWRMA